MANFTENLTPHWIGSSCGNGMICCNKEENMKFMMTEATCGTRFPIGAGFYNEAKGNNAQYSEFNWMTSIEEGSNKICSGSLIDSNLVITSAACIDGKSADSLRVRLGSWKTNSQQSKPDTVEVHKVNKIIFKLSPVNKIEPNVALLVLETPANLNMYINTACLPPADQSFEGKTCTVVGWGNGKSANDDLKKFDVNVNSCQGSSQNSICIQSNENFETGATLNCLIVNTTNLYQTVGIVMSDSTPQTFLKVGEFKAWVDEKSTEVGAEKESYTYSRLRPRFWGRLVRAFMAGVNHFFS
jgi:hypothetical protein